MKTVSLIICTMNRDNMIDDVLNSSINQTLSKDKYEIIVIDQSINNKTKEIVQNYSEVKYIKSKTTGLSNSRNEGIKHSSGDIIVFVDDDVFFESDYLENILYCFNNSDLKPDFIGGKTHIKYLGKKPEWITGPLLGILAHSDYGDEEKCYDNHPKHVPYGCNMAIKRKCIEKINGFSSIIKNFDNRLTENEDVIAANKLRKLGFNLAYCPKMFVMHKMPASRLNYAYYKKRYYSQGQSDAFIYYYLGEYSLKDVPLKIFIHFKRLIESIFLRFWIKNIPDLYYQKLRLHYNLGYLKTLFKLNFE